MPKASDKIPQILAILGEEHLTPKEIGERVGMTRGGASTTLDALKKEGKVAPVGDGKWKLAGPAASPLKENVASLTEVVEDVLRSGPKTSAELHEAARPRLNGRNESGISQALAQLTKWGRVLRPAARGAVWELAAQGNGAKSLEDVADRASTREADKMARERLLAKKKQLQRQIEAIDLVLEGW